MKNLEPEIRAMLLHIMKILVFACMGTAFLFFLFYLVTDKFQDGGIGIYFIKRLLVPFSINLLAYELAKRFNASEDHTDEQKNMLCSFALCTLAGCVAIFYSFFTPLWCCPATAVMFCMVFQNEKLLKGLLVYNIILIALALLWSYIEKPNEIYYYTQHAVVVVIISFLLYITGILMQRYTEKLLNLTKEMYQTKQEYEEQLQFDALTGVYSRRYMMKKAEEHIKDCDSNHPVSVAIIDIDNFKRVNDTYGHENGDVVLERLGSILRPYIKDDLTIGRFGGEEFVFVFEGINTSAYKNTLENIRETFGKERFDFFDGNITLSGGFVSCFAKKNFDEVLEIADQGLYYSKEHGKNQIHLQERIL